MVWYQEVVQRLLELGLLDLILPFMLIFVVVFAIMQKSHILGDETKGKKFNVIIALVMGLLVVLPHVAYGGAPNDAELTLTTATGTHFPDVVDIINNALPSISVWLIAILMVMLLLGMLGAKDMGLKEGSVRTWAIIIAVIIVGYVFALSANWFDTPSWLGWLNDRTNQAVLMILLVFGAVIAYVTGGETEPGKPGTLGKIFEGIGKGVKWD